MKFHTAIKSIKCLSYQLLITSLFYIFATTISTAQKQLPNFNNQEYFIQQFTDEDGLPQNSVKKISADDSGFIWLATDAGLTRFDGQRFLHYNESASIRGVHSFEPDSIDPSNGFYAITDQYDKIRIRASVAKLLETDPTTRKRYQLDSYLPFPDSLSTRGLPESINGTVFPHHLIMGFAPNRSIICSDSSVSYLEKGKKKYRSPSLGNDKWQYFRINNTLYYLEKDGNLKYINFSDLSPKTVTQKLEGISFTGSKKNTIFWSNTNNQALISSGDALFLLRRGETGKVVPVQILSNFNFDDQKIISIYYDQIHQKLFLGSSTNGLYVISPKHFTTLTSPLKTNINHNVYYGQLLLKDQSILTTQGEIFEWKDPKNIKNSENKLLKKHFNGDKYSRQYHE